MILTAFRLARDRHTESQSFGYTRPFWPEENRGCNHFAPTLGFAIELPTRLTANIFKIVEFYQRSVGSVIVERLAWAFDSAFYPYRAKYIHVDKEGYTNQPLLFLPHMAKIHEKLSGIDVSFASPFQFYLNSTIHDDYSWFGHTRSHQLHDIYQRNRAAIDGIALQETDALKIQHLFQVMDNECSPETLERQLHDWFIPKIPIQEPMSFQYWCDPIQRRTLALEGHGGNHFDTTPVGELTITHPEVTLYSPKDAHRIAMVLEDISQFYTDVKIEYILSHGYVTDSVIVHTVSRYCEKPNLPVVMHYCTDIVLSVMLLVERHYQGRFIPPQVKAVLTLSYGDEALIEIFTPDGKRCLYALHLDLALIALCSSNVVAQTVRL